MLCQALGSLNFVWKSWIHFAVCRIFNNTGHFKDWYGSFHINVNNHCLFMKYNLYWYKNNEQLSYPRYKLLRSKDWRLFNTLFYDEGSLFGRCFIWNDINGLILTLYLTTVLQDGSSFMGLCFKWDTASVRTLVQGFLIRRCFGLKLNTFLFCGIICQFEYIVFNGIICLLNMLYFVSPLDFWIHYISWGKMWKGLICFFI